MARQRTSSVAKLRLFIAVRLLVLSIALVIAGCDLLPRPPAPTSAAYCTVAPSPADPGDIAIEVWAPAPRQHCLRLFAPLLAARESDNISVVALEKTINAGPYNALIHKAIKKQSAPDIAFLRNSEGLLKLAGSNLRSRINNC